jgi:hypothetical protein
MHPEDDSQTTLSKWPFVLGDVLLVGTGLAIAILGDWRLTNWQVGACVAAVALGAALFVLPYLVEYYVRVREEGDDRASAMRLFEKHIRRLEEEVTSLDARLRSLADTVDHSDQPHTALAEGLDQKLARAEQARAAQDDAIQALRKEISALTESTPRPAFDPQILEPLEARLKVLESRIEERPEPDPAPKAVEVASAAEPAGEAVPSAEGKPPKATAKKTASHIRRPKRASRERHGPEEARLLQRAITERGDHSSAAVSRIIGSKTPKPTVETPEQSEASKVPQSEPAEADPPETDGAESVSAEASSGPIAEKETETAPGAASEDQAEEKDAKMDAPPQEPDDEAEADKPDMLFDEEKITSPVKRTKAKKNDAVLTATVFIGIGNKPYLRGSGGGLSWEKGILMEFQEIGKWRWVAPSDLDTAVEVQIFRNDEDPDQSGKYTLDPGQKLEVSPVF